MSYNYDNYCDYKWEQAQRENCVLPPIAWTRERVAADAVSSLEQDANRQNDLTHDIFCRLQFVPMFMDYGERPVGLDTLIQATKSWYVCGFQLSTGSRKDFRLI
ncbi:uncharacterized protein LOC109601327 [Aethina tumida]|uniref:uncharacterized protein LOC109601327 n=1 Tax=Aethina tumida TaxID=116153 RepID=UPI00096B4E8B|nr:uncharacterized protein LOC109601327 [Aethina tumida]